MPADPLAQPCAHLATPEERQRDPAYLWCNAQPGQPCVWARRHDGFLNPPFHSERIEYAANAADPTDELLSKEAFDDLILGTGLV